MGLGERRAQRRRMREMERRLVELDRLDREHGLGAMPGSLPSGGAPRRARKQRGPVIPGLVIAVIAVVSAMLLDPSAYGQRLRALIGLEERLADQAWADGDGVYAFLQTQRGSAEPVGWSPCRPVRYAVNPAGAPEGWEELVGEAVEEIERITGLAFEDAGTTEDRNFDARHDVLGRPQPVLIGWADAKEVPDLAGDVAGIGGSASTSRAGRAYYVTGAIALDTDVFDDLARDRDGRAFMRAIVLHELAHVVGLDHVDDESELMHADNVGRTDFGPGDLEGLALLGAVPCG